MYPTWSILYILLWALALRLDYQVDSTPIVGGIVVRKPEIFRYSYMVSLQDRKEEVNGTAVRFEHFCGGSLVSPVWVLTAAHCVYRKKITGIVAAIGYENLKATDIARQRVSEVRLNNFSPLNLRNDIALVKLEFPIVLDEGRSLGLLPRPVLKMDHEKPCQIIGYGAKKYNGQIANELNMAEVKVVSQQTCLDILGRIIAPKEGDNAICAFGDSQDSCQGDSGGPLICPFQGEDYIYGIVSHGLICGEPGVPSIYTLTAPYKNWMDEVINKRSFSSSC